MFRKTPLLLSLFKKRKEEEKRSPRGILFYYISFPSAQKDSWGISVLKVTDGLGADAVIETTASAGGFSDALSSVRKRGSIVLVGGYHKPLEVHLSRIVGSEIRVTGSSCYGYSGMRKDFEWSIDLISSGKIPVSKLITHRFTLNDVQEAFEVAADKKTGSIKVWVYNDTAPRAQ